MTETLTEPLTVRTERVDDIPLLIAHMREMNLPWLLESSFLPHGNRQGLSVGWTLTVWLAHILSQGDHRMNQVQSWVTDHLETLRSVAVRDLQALDCTDDRLADILRMLSNDAAWADFEFGLTKWLLRVYDLRPTRARVDTTTAMSYGPITEAGLFQLGHSKDHRPDLAQIKVVLVTLDPFGLPVATEVVDGSRADDPLYLPTIARVRTSLPRGMLYVGDCKMAALATRAGIVAGEDHYLCPLPTLQVPTARLDQYLATARANGPPTVLRRTTADGHDIHIADGYEWTESLTADGPQGLLTWTERRLLVRSLTQAQTAETTLRRRLARAQAALDDLSVRRQGKRPVLTDRRSAETQVAAILKRYHVAEIVDVTLHETVTQQLVRAYRGRPAEVRETRQITLTQTVNPTALAAAIDRLGWRVYVTTQPAGELSLAEAVLAYREEYLIERGMGRLKGAALALTPLYLTREDHVTGLVRLLSIGLRVLTLLEGVVRRRLAETQERLAGLYAGQPTRTTAQPTAEQLLRALRGITLSIITEPDRQRRHLTPLSPLQQRIVALLDCQYTIYTPVNAQSP